MRSISVDRLIQGEVGCRVVECLIQRGIRLRERLGESSNIFIKVAFALRSSNRRSRSVVIVEGLGSQQAQ